MFWREREREREKLPRKCSKIPKKSFYFLNLGCLGVFIPLSIVLEARRPFGVCQVGYADVSNFVFFFPNFDRIFVGLP